MKTLGISEIDSCLELMAAAETQVDKAERAVPADIPERDRIVEDHAWSGQRHCAGHNV